MQLHILYEGRQLQLDYEPEKTEDDNVRKLDKLHWDLAKKSLCTEHTYNSDTTDPYTIRWRVGPDGMPQAGEEVLWYSSKPTEDGKKVECRRLHVKKISLEQVHDMFEDISRVELSPSFIKRLFVGRWWLWYKYSKIGWPTWVSQSFRYDFDEVIWASSLHHAVTRGATLDDEGTAG